MKLISKTLVYYLLISLPLLLIACLFSYYFIKAELQDGTDETLLTEKTHAERFIRSFKEPHAAILSMDSLSAIVIVKNQPTALAFSDTAIFDTKENEFIPYRVLKANYTFNNATYQLTLFKAILEKEELIEGLSTGFALIIAFLIVSFFVVNWLLSKKLWKPFYHTLSGLTDFDIKKQERQYFNTVNTEEFDQLNTALNKMTEKLYADFIQQKEFIENASHEMQTPLAVMKANLSLLIQSPTIKEKEIDQLQTVDDNIKKLAALNKALILLSKIENNQFKETESVNFKTIIQKKIDHFSERIQAKNITLELDLITDLFINMDAILADVLVTNLLQNAIRHNHKQGNIRIDLKGNTFTIFNTGSPLNIEPEALFMRFKKDDASKKSLGLGLSIVKSIVTHYHFNISYNYTNNLHSFKINF